MTISQIKACIQKKIRRILQEYRVTGMNQHYEQN